MTLKKLILVGTNTTAETIYKVIKFYNLFEVMGFAVDNKYRICDVFQGLPVFDLASIDNYCDKENDFLFVAMQWNRLNKDRRDVYERLKSAGYKFANIISPHSIIYTKSIGYNCWIADYAYLDSDTIIGNNVFVKQKAFVGHYTSIADHCFIGCNSYIAGGCGIGEQTFIGVCATLFDKVIIGEKCIIGASTIIKRNVPSYTIVKVNVANQQLQQYDSETIESKLLAKGNIR